LSAGVVGSQDALLDWQKVAQEAFGSGMLALFSQ
jgi:hypothetical protein